MSILVSKTSIHRLRGTRIRRRETVLMDASACEWDERKKAADGARMRSAGSSLSSFGQIFLPSFNVGSKSERMAAKPERGMLEKRGGKKARVARPALTKRNLSQVNVDLLRQWEASFDALLQHPDGVVLFEDFLKSEFSEENIQFWKACERYKLLPDEHLRREAEAIFEEFVSQQAPKLVNIDHQTTKGIMEQMTSPTRNTFTKAQQSVYLLMARDSFIRFVKSGPFQSALKR